MTKRKRVQVVSRKGERLDGGFEIERQTLGKKIWWNAIHYTDQGFVSPGRHVSVGCREEALILIKNWRAIDAAS